MELKQGITAVVADMIAELIKADKLEICLRLYKRYVS